MINHNANKNQYACPRGTASFFNGVDVMGVTGNRGALISLRRRTRGPGSQRI